MPVHASEAVEDGPCECDQKNEKLQCFYVRAAKVPFSDKLSDEDKQKAHLQNCREIVKQYTELNTTLQALGGSVWVIACVSHASINDIDSACGAAADKLANELDKRNICLGTLMRSYQLLVDIDKSKTLAASLKSGAAIQTSLGTSMESGPKIRIQTGAYRRNDAQNEVRALLKDMLAERNIHITKKGHFPKGFWEKYLVQNWPEEILPVSELNKLSVQECSKVMSAREILRIIPRGSEVAQEIPKKVRSQFECVLIPQPYGRGSK